LKALNELLRESMRGDDIMRLIYSEKSQKPPLRILRSFAGVITEVRTMILNTTYLLTLARIKIDTGLLKAVTDGKIDWKLEEITVSLISIFELQAKDAKLKIPANSVSEAIEAIFRTFKVELFYKPEIIAASFKVRKLIPDYLDCVIVATAVALREKLITKDSLILSEREVLEKEYGISIQSYGEVVRS